ncbi:MAG TPA: hypothetical protein VER58_16950 [Thermoanaerobaculia bacterium]|nr:hypothetical protein [Thermoanaerobaculia bacterium]
MLFEEQNRMAIGWIVTDNVSPGLASGTTLAGFDVTVDKADSEYLSGPYTAIFDDGTTAVGRINAK